MSDNQTQPFHAKVTGALFAALCWLIRPFARAFAREAYRELELEFANATGAIAGEIKLHLTQAPIEYSLTDLEQLRAASFPGEAQPLTDEQRSHLEEMRNRYSPDRQRVKPAALRPEPERSP